MFLSTSCQHYAGEKPKEEGQSNDGLSSGSIIGIIIACVVTALIILILLIAAIIAVYHERNKRKGRIQLKSTNPDVIDGYELIDYVIYLYRVK